MSALNQSACTAKKDFETRNSVWNFVALRRHIEDEVFMSLDGITLGVNLELC